ncbi:VanZ family protein [Clostridium sardiniense]|uniref:VanZ family protein n=1 Tax=Clostridium sardiniense TaxID=29369 RepID=A0ABS7KYR0_CLOSR|nr:VanZ family protein [Clostridium sardiniense]MBY0755956.1 VanZ family protein [Clostridium sardiniense]MDQ0460754.1 glycopeptide antibiotics resistance protein [Clostridium sardiniense]
MIHLNSGFLILISIPFIIILNILFFKMQKRSNLKFSTKRVIWNTLFAIYILLVMSVTIFPIIINTQRTIDVSATINLVPFKETINSFNSLLDSFSTLFAIKLFLVNVLGNILLFTPLGFLLPIVNPNINNIKPIFKISLIATISIELIQFITSLSGGFRVTDIDDVILNILGGLFGFLIFTLFSKVKLFKLIMN